MAYILSQILGWIATVFRAAGMLAKEPKSIKWLVSIGNLGWMLSGVFTGNIPLIVSNALCLIVMLVDIIKDKKSSKKGDN
jgi:hypothetical protein